MLYPKVTAIVFEGGSVKTPLEATIANVRQSVVLDTLQKLMDAPDIDRVILVTNYPKLAGVAQGMGVVVDFDEPARSFHFGNRLRGVIVKHRAENVIYMGGAAAPLLSSQEFNDVAATLKRERNLVIANNVQSADLVAFAPGRAIDEIELPDNDNSLGNLLRDIGMRRLLIPNSGRVNFDLDTPTDYLILGLHPDCGPRGRKAIESLDWPKDELLRAFDVLKHTSQEIAVIGRVAPAVIQYINANMVHRVRVFSEERGMKALGREGRGEVVSLLGHLIERVGPEEFFAFLATVADVAFIDSRVIFGHLKKRLPEWDRFNSDLGLYELVDDPWTREFTRCAREARIPVVLGGHSLVAAGLWLLAEMVVVEKEAAGYRRGTFAMAKPVSPS